MQIALHLTYLPNPQCLRLLSLLKPSSTYLLATTLQGSNKKTAQKSRTQTRSFPTTLIINLKSFPDIDQKFTEIVFKI